MSYVWQELLVVLIFVLACVYLGIYLTGFSPREALARFLLERGKVAWAMRLRKFNKKTKYF